MSTMNTGLFVNATIGFSENLFPVDAASHRKAEGQIDLNCFKCFKTVKR